MAIRVRKLARELERSPWDILGICLAIGYTRYRSPEDMLPDNAVQKVRSAIRDGVSPLPVPGRREAEARRAAPRESRPKDLMSGLVPGVVPQRGRRAPPPRRERPEPPPAQTPAEPTEAEQTALELERAALSDERSALEDARVGLDARRASLDRERAEVDEALSALQRGRDELDQERDAISQQREALDRIRGALDARRQALDEAGGALDAARLDLDARTVSGRSLDDLLSERGLRGADEQERALGALASRRLLRELVVELEATDPERALAVLRRRLVLVGGEVPELPSGLAAVAVAPERAELPDGPEIERQIGRMSELLMLHGLRRVAVVGGRPAWQRLVHGGLDGRIEPRFAPATPRGRAAAEADVTRTDAVLLWGVEVLPEGREVYATSRAVVVEAEGDGILDLVEAVRRTLESG